MPTSLRASRGTRSVLLLMAQAQDRADRIRALKKERPDLTWRRIADHVGVAERSATDWQVTGGIEYDNAKKLAEIFEVDLDYLWRGAAPTAPDPFADRNASEDRQDRIEARLESIERKLDKLISSGDRHSVDPEVVRQVLRNVRAQEGLQDPPAAEPGTAPKGNHRA